MFLEMTNLIYMYQKDLALDTLECLIGLKTQPN